METSPRTSDVLNDSVLQTAESVNSKRQYARRNTEYLSAVGAGDLDTAQRMVDEAAEEMVNGEQGEQNQQDVQQTVQYSVRKDYLLSKAEYARLQSNLNNQRYGYQFKNRPNGGKMVVMGNLLVYTDRKGTPEHVLEVDDTDVWAINDIQQLMMQLEEDGTDYEVQQSILRGVYPEASAHFRSGGERTRIGGKDGTGTGQNARSDGERDRGEVSAERKGIRNQYALRDTEYLSAVEASDTAAARGVVCVQKKEGIAVPTKTPSTEKNQLRGHGNDLPAAIIRSDQPNDNREFAKDVRDIIKSSLLRPGRGRLLLSYFLVKP